MMVLIRARVLGVGGGGGGGDGGWCGREGWETSLVRFIDG